MHTTRRDFLTTLGSGALAFGAAPSLLPTGAGGNAGGGRQAPIEPYDLTWPRALSTPHRALFDVAAIDSGRGVWRATLWEQQYRDHLALRPTELTSVMVVRGEAIPLVMQQAFWDRYGIGELYHVVHPISQRRTDRNPALLSSRRNEVPATLDASALDQYLARGRSVLACDVAFREIEQLIMKVERIDATEARRRATAFIVPGVRLQPSGVFAVVRAQEAGAHYVRAS